MRNPSHMEDHTKCTFSRTLHFKLNIMCIVADHENYVYVRWIYLTIVLCMGEGQKYARSLVFD